MTKNDCLPSFKDRVAIITGAATGLGAAIAQLLSQAGARVVINHMPNQESQAQAVAEDCPNQTLCYAADITQDEQCKAMVQAAFQRWGQIAPAFAAGKAVVVKPSEQTPSSTLVLAEIPTEAGIPDGLFNVVLGIGCTTGKAIASHIDIDKRHLTGSVATGRQLMQYAGNRMVSRRCWS